MKKFRVFIGIVAVIALIAIGFMSAKLMDRSPKVTVDTTAIEERLTECSSLTTCRLDYRGMVKYEEGDITFINKKGFSMIYDAQIRAGIDLSKAKVTIKGNTIDITLPDPEIQNITIDSDSLEFYDEQFALFNWNNKEDTAKALTYAEEDARSRAEQSDLLEQADEQAKTVIETMLMPISSDNSNSYTVNVH